MNRTEQLAVKTAEIALIALERITALLDDDCDETRVALYNPRATVACIRRELERAAALLAAYERAEEALQTIRSAAEKLDPRAVVTLGELVPIQNAVPPEHPPVPECSSCKGTGRVFSPYTPGLVPCRCQYHCDQFGHPFDPVCTCECHGTRGLMCDPVDCCTPALKHEREVHS